MTPASTSRAAATAAPIRAASTEAGRAAGSPSSSAGDSSTVATAGDWVRPRPGRREIRNDLLLALALAIGTTASVALTRIAGLFSDSPVWAVGLWIVGISLPIALRRVYPEVVALFIAAVFVAGATAGATETLFSNISLFIAIYTLGAWGRRRRQSIAIRLFIVVGMFAWLFWVLLEAAGRPDAAPDLSREGALSPYVAYGLIQVLTNLLYFGGAFYFGESALRSAASRSQLAERTRELTAERARTQAQAIALERVRIARELHDVVAHHVSVMGVQAGAARRVLESKPQLAREALSAIEENARSAVDELHQLLRTLRSDDGEAAAEAAVGATTRGVEQLSELVAEANAAGLPTTLVVVGEPSAVPATVGLGVYRIAQEALTNSRKHAGPKAGAELRLRYSEEFIELEASDTGIGSSAAPASAQAAEGSGPGGLGLIGMRERVDMVGGTIEIGPRSRGGYLVRARLPLHPAPIEVFNDAPADAPGRGAAAERSA